MALWPLRHGCSARANRLAGIRSVLISPCWLPALRGWRKSNSTVREITVVCDRWDGTMQELLSELAAQLHALPKETSQ